MFPGQVDLLGYGFTGFSLSVVLTALALLALGYVILLSEEDPVESVGFFILTVLTAAWLLPTALMQAAPDPEAARQWAGASLFALPLVPGALYHFTTLMLNITDSRRAALGAMWGVGGAMAVAILGTDLLLANVDQRWWGYFPEYGRLGPGFAAFMVAGLGASIAEYAAAYRRCEPGEKRRRVGWFLVAFGVGLFTLTDFLPAFGLDVYPYGHVAVLAMFVLVALGVNRYHLVILTPAFAAGRILQTMGDGVAVFDLEGKIQVVNRALCALLGRDEDELLGAPAGILAVEEAEGEGSEEEETPLQQLVREREIKERRTRLHTRDGEKLPASVSLTTVADSDGRDAGRVLIARDIRERLEAERQLEWMALYDSLTGLPNRNLFQDRLRRAMRDPEVEGGDVAVLYFDVDRFKVINDTLGHGAGDQVLAEVARRLEACFRDPDTVARPSGDEFAALVRRPAAEESALSAARRALKVLETPISAGGTEVHVSASVGVAVNGREGGGEEPEELLRHAEIAMYRAKEEDGRSLRVFDPASDAALTRRLHLENALRRAVDREEFFLEYQPLVEVDTGNIVGAEALVRWQHPEHGRVLPGEFIPVLEETGLIVPVGDWILRRACRTLRRWREDAGEGRPLRMSVNLSAREFQAPDLVGRIRATLEETGCRASDLQMEITERLVIQSRTRLDELDELGVRLAIDDFGTGYSSLGYLRNLPVDILKIDRTFVSGLGEDGRDEAVARTVLTLARELGLNTVAEGVETETQRRSLEEMGCPVGQGWLFARPMPEEELMEVLRDERVERRQMELELVG